MHFPFNLGSSYVTLDGSTTDRLSRPEKTFRTVEVLPPFEEELPATLDRFVKAVTEYQTELFGIRNRSPTVAYEIHRFNPQKLRLQFSVPSMRLERKLRTHLNEQVSGAGFREGVDTIPLNDGDTVGVGTLTLRKKDVHPLQTTFEKPPTNSLVTALHRDAMRDSRILIQLLSTPMAGQPVKKRLWHRKASKESQKLRSEKIGVLPWNDRDPTPRERNQARHIEKKAGSPRFNTSIRILVIGARKYTASRIKEVSGGFNIFADPETGQGFRTEVVRSLRRKPIIDSVKNIRDREPTRQFQLSTEELSALLTIPDREQDNIENAV
ncbi:hypothetical protein Harman_41680 [Haloarcula mannanilytica]|uniref:DUF8128 domain-containing protein n=1 Tax=Haloarcula mannanilytica TaxID=2509225 RepID=A0A4C2EUB3_9EURY|nr:hypothetical protein [Haloarcula mannanilytica]GCF16233.1 hypothetical protein Harman_41680 [Haloarcula mannanilytica]